MIMEPYHAPSAQFHKIKPTIERIRTLQKEFPYIPLCLDEVQGGFGRTGRLFAYEWYEDLIKPNFVAIGKACAGGIALSALLGPRAYLEQKEAWLHTTHAGNPLASAVGIAILQEIEKKDLIARSYTKGLMLERLLKDIPIRSHSGRGLLAGLEFESKELADKVYITCREKGLLVIPTGRKWIKLGPALIIDDDLLGKGIEILKKSIEKVMNNELQIQKETSSN
jgi:acetylornithine/succinyldiaminopimelate/putrescine aminotransferase